MENRPGKLSSAPLRELWQARELVALFAQRDLRVRYRQAALGVLWVLGQPVAGVLVFTVVFAHLTQVNTAGVPYPMFALAGLLAWNYFVGVVVSGSDVLVDNSSLVTKVYFQRLAAPVSALLPPLVDLLVAAGLLVPLWLAYQVFPGWRLLALPLWVLLLIVTALGPCLWLSALNVRYRDVRHAIAPLLQIGLFLSPVAYPATELTGWARWVYALNPMAGPIDFGRWCLLGSAWPGWTLAVSTGSALLLFGLGYRYFRRSERSFADVV